MLNDQCRWLDEEGRCCEDIAMVWGGPNKTLYHKCTPELCPYVYSEEYIENYNVSGNTFEYNGNRYPISCLKED